MRVIGRVSERETERQSCTTSGMRGTFHLTDPELSFRGDRVTFQLQQELGDIVSGATE